jgi:hypothetical protein
LVAWFAQVDTWRNRDRRHSVEHPPVPPRIKAPTP